MHHLYQPVIAYCEASGCTVDHEELLNQFVVGLFFAFFLMFVSIVIFGIYVDVVLSAKFVFSNAIPADLRFSPCEIDYQF